MADPTGTNHVNLIGTLVVNCYAEYDEAIDDACHALDVSGQQEAWQIVRSLRGIKRPLENSNG